MSQNLISLDLDDARLAAIDDALAQLEAALSGLIALTGDDRRELYKMGARSEPFCRQTLSVLEQNPQIVPPSLELAESLADLAALDRLRPRMDRLTRLAERMADTEMALGSDIATTALQGYALLKVTGRGQGLEGLRSQLARRFDGQRRKPAAVGNPTAN